ncbi:MAG: hypothetical protein SNJ70_09035 [Armatimonadota bacterium]
MRLYTLLALSIILFALLSDSVSAQSHYALGTSKTGIYLLQSNGSSTEYIKLYTDTARDFTGIAVYGEYAFVADTSKNKLLIFKTSDIGGSAPKIEKTKEIDLKNQNDSLTVDRPQNVVVTSNGTVFVTGSRYQDSSNNYYYTYSMISNPTESWHTQKVSNLPNAPITDIDIFSNIDGDNAIIVHQQIGAVGVPSYRAHVTSISPYGAPSVTTALGSGNDFPVGISVNNKFGESGYAYIASRVSSINESGLAIVDCASMTQVGNISYTLDMTPQSLVSFNYGSQSFIGMVTNKSTDLGSTQEIWRILLDSDGLPTSNIQSWTLNTSDHSTQHKIIASDDGSIVWVSNPTAGTVIALNTNNWAQIGSSIAIGDSLFRLANIEANFVIPEPSTFAGLVCFGLSTIAFAGRKLKK